MRRKDREVTDDSWIDDFLITAPFGTLATAIGLQPFVTHNTFYYDDKENAIYMHTAHNGHLRSAIEENNRVCFTAATMGRLLPAKTAREMSVEYASVIVYGTAGILTDMKKAVDKMSLLIKKYFPHLHAGSDYRPITVKEILEICVFEIRIESKTAKKKETDSNFPGAFKYSAPPAP